MLSMEEKMLKMAGNLGIEVPEDMKPKQIPMVQVPCSLLGQRLNDRLSGFDNGTPKNASKLQILCDYQRELIRVLNMGRKAHIACEEECKELREKVRALTQAKGG